MYTKYIHNILGYGKRDASSLSNAEDFTCTNLSCALCGSQIPLALVLPAQFRAPHLYPMKGSRCDPVSLGTPTLSLLRAQGVRHLPLPTGLRKKTGQIE